MTLKPCPFCNERVNEHLYPHIKGCVGTYSVVCDLCGARGPHANSPTKARNYWNNRQPLQDIDQVKTAYCVFLPPPEEV